MSTPYDRFFWQLREIQKALDLAQPRLTEFQDLSVTIQAQIEQFRRLEETFTLPRDYLDTLHRIQEQLTFNPAFEQLPRLAAHADEFFQEFRDRQRELDRTVQRIREMQEVIPSPAAGILTSLAGVEALLGSVELSGTALQAAIRPQIAFQDFLVSQFDRIAATSSSIAKAGRLRFVDAASDLLDEMTKGFELGVLIAPHLASAELRVDWEVNVFSGLGRKAEGAPFEDERFEADALVFDSCEGSVVRLGLQLIRLVYNLNTEAEREGRSEVFKPTTKSLYACSLIPSQIATEAESFYGIVDQLFFLLYEGSGTANRLTEGRGTTRFEALWRLKHLRHDARHDVDHGDKREIAKKRERAGKAFVSLIGAVVPKTSGDWCRAQLSLYEQLVSMLEKIWFNEEGEDDGSEPTAGADG